MIVNKYVLQLKVSENETLFYNPLTGAKDVVDNNGVDLFASLRRDPEHPISNETKEYLLERGYVYQTVEDEEQILSREFEEFRAHEKFNSLRFFIAPTYDCTARCPYCFVHEIIGRPQLMDLPTMNAAFEVMDELVERKGQDSQNQLILFGGEPLIDKPEQRAIVERILIEGQKRGFILDAVSNALDLPSYVEMLAHYNFGKIQVTIDGLPEYANKRRPAVDKKGRSFYRIVEGINAALDSGIQINARLMLDKTSIHMLPDLVRFMDEQGWFSHVNFSSHVGSVFDCFSNLSDREVAKHLKIHEGNQLLIDVCREHPEVADKICIDWHGARSFMRSGMLPAANFNSCPGGKRTFAFDLLGKIYLCESTIGKPDFAIGSFYPEVTWNTEIIDWLEQRNSTKQEGCKSCNQALLCAGGCPYSGQVHGTTIKDLGCRSMKETMEYGMQYYWPKIRELAVLDGVPAGGR